MPEKTKKKYTYGDKPRQRTQRMFELLLDCAFQEMVLETGETCTQISSGDLQYRYKLTKKGLTQIANRKDWKNGKGWEFNDVNDERWKSEIYPALSHYLGDNFLGILEGESQQGSSKWSFKIKLWHSEKAENLKIFAEKWEEAKNARSKAAIPQVKKADQSIYWRTTCQNLLNKQKQQITSSPLHRKAKDLDSVHVPLGLMERKESERPKFDRAQEISPERGSETYQQGYTETKRVEHDAFLAAISQCKPGEHVVILGEPGAGKTTLLMKVWEWLLEHDQPGEDIIVAWVPLAAVKNNELEEYLRKSWIKQFCKTGEIDRYWASFESLADAGQVYLLLDGADEMVGDALGKIEVTLKEVWSRSTRAVITCRLNLWDTNSHKLQTSSDFQVYRTLNFKYVNPAGWDEVKVFIDNWFRSTKEPEAGHKLRTALDEVGKERIKDLVQNPLRLTLLCDIWDDKKELPDTQAGLYELFVDYVYDWKAKEFPDAMKLRGELDRALGDLAKQGINKPSLRFRFTEAELRRWVPVGEQCQALMDLGWLNCVGEENKRPVFAFFHPTFQEYFAACSIDDWDYFLPRAHVDRPVPCLGEEEKEPTYRVFESEWRQVILLWFGRKDVADEVKEKFIDKLTNFREQEGKFYYYRAYFMAAICISEFKFSLRAEAIVEQLVGWAFGIFQAEENMCGFFPNPIKWMAEAELLYTDINKVVDNIARNIIPISINGSNSNKDAALIAAKTLGLIGGNNPRAVKALTELIQCSNELFYFVRIEASKSLAKIAAGNEQAIHDLMNLLSVNQNKEVQTQIASCIGHLDQKNQSAVYFFATAINEAENEDDKLNAAWSILSFDEQNDIAINTLTDLARSSDNNVSHFAVKLLEQGYIFTYDDEEYDYSQNEIEYANEICTNSHSVFDLLCDNVSTTSPLAFHWGLREIQRHLKSNYAGTVNELCKELHESQDITTLQSIIEILGKFAVGDEQVVKELIIFLENGNGNLSLAIIPNTFYRIINSSNHEQLCCLIIKKLSEYIRNSYFNQGADFNQIYNVVWICVRSMRYHDFYQALQS